MTYCVYRFHCKGLMNIGSGNTANIESGKYRTSNEKMKNMTKTNDYCVEFLKRDIEDRQLAYDWETWYQIKYEVDIDDDYTNIVIGANPPSQKGKEPWNKGKTGCYSAEVIEQWRAVKKGKYKGEKNPMYNKKHTDEAKAKMRAKKIGTTQSAEHKAKGAAARIGNTNTKDRKYYHNPKTGVRKLLKPEQIKEHESQGFIKGMGEKNPMYIRTGENSPTGGRKYYHNPKTGVRKMLKPEQIAEFEAQGFIKGMGGK